MAATPIGHAEGIDRARSRTAVSRGTLSDGRELFELHAFFKRREIGAL